MLHANDGVWILNGDSLFLFRPFLMFVLPASQRFIQLQMLLVPDCRQNDAKCLFALDCWSRSENIMRGVQISKVLLDFDQAASVCPQLFDLHFGPLRLSRGRGVGDGGLVSGRGRRVNVRVSKNVTEVTPLLPVPSFQGSFRAGRPAGLGAHDRGLSYGVTSWAWASAPVAASDQT